jgi:hypothetical protein
LKLTQREEVNQAACHNLFAMGLPPFWCLVLARASHVLCSDLPNSLSEWWWNHKDILFALSDSYAMEVFINTEQMVSKSSTIKLLHKLEDGSLSHLTCSAFLAQLQPVLMNDLQITASFRRGDSVVPHHWTPAGLNTLHSWIDRRMFRN